MMSQQKLILHRSSFILSSGGILSVALSRSLRTVGVTHHRVLRSPDFPPLEPVSRPKRRPSSPLASFVIIHRIWLTWYDVAQRRVVRAAFSNFKAASTRCSPEPAAQRALTTS